VLFDPFMNDIFMNSTGVIEQFDPVSGPYDQAAEDGKRHSFLASNLGYLEFLE